MTTLTIDPKYVRPLDGSVSVRGAAGEAGANGDLVYLNDDDLWWQTDANTAGTLGGRLLGLIVAGSKSDPDGDIVANEDISVLIWGPVYLGPNVGLVGTVQYYASDTKGGIEDAPGTVVRRLGSRISDTEFFFAPTVAAAGS